MGENVTLERIRELKEKAVMALINNKGQFGVDAEIDYFLTVNKYSILDMLDDALTAYETKEE